MTADFTGTMRPIFRGQVEPQQEVRLESVSGSVFQAKLSLALQAYPVKQPPLAAFEQGAILVVDMRWEELVLLYGHIRRYAQQMDWPLPE
jgi:hypothetical protein